MEAQRIVILPGLDGTDLLLARFLELAPPGYTVTVMTLPDDPTADYESLSRPLTGQLRELASCHLVAESFSGPLGIKLASRHPDLIARLTLVASFVDSPVPWLARWLPWSLLFRVPLPLLAARYYFTGDDEKVARTLKNAIRQTSPETLTKRIHCVLNVDERAALESLRCPIRYLRPTRDRLVPARVTRRITDINGRVMVKEIDGPHLILQTRPEQAWLAITAPES